MMPKSDKYVTVNETRSLTSGRYDTTSTRRQWLLLNGNFRPRESLPNGEELPTIFADGIDFLNPRLPAKVV